MVGGLRGKTGGGEGAGQLAISECLGEGDV